MKRSVRYGVLAVPKRSALHLSVDDRTYNEKREAFPGLAGVIEHLKGEKVVNAFQLGGITTHIFDLARIGRRTSARNQENDLYATTLVASVLGDRDKLSKTSPDLAVSLGLYGVSGVLPMAAQIKWPKNRSDQWLSAYAGRGMRVVAADLRYAREPEMGANAYQARLNNLVYAHVDRSRYVSIGTNPAVSCSLDTTGDEFEPEAESFIAETHNIAGYKQQLICLVGAVGIAQPDNLVM